MNNQPNLLNSIVQQDIIPNNINPLTDNEHLSFNNLLKSINKQLEINHLHHNGVNCLIVLSDGRIVTGSYCSVTICETNLLLKQYNILISTENAHDD